MSVDLFVYSERPEPVPRAALAEALRRKGWHAIFLDQEHMKEVAGGALGNDLVYGTKKAAVLDRLRGLLKKGDDPKLEELFENEDAGGCGVYATGAFDPHAEMGEDLEGQVGPEIAGHLLKAKSHYTVGTAAGRTELSSEFQNTVWKTLGEVAGGVLEDPQTGEYLLSGPQGEKVLAEPDDSEGSALGNLKSYFQAAKAAGFPVDATKTDANLNTSQLSQADLERLLAFTRKHFPKEDMSGPAMVAMILEEYLRKKGKAFARDQAMWFEQMMEKYGGF